MSVHILSPPPHKRDYKVLVVGNSSVGKSNFIQVSTGVAEFNEQTRATLGVSFSTRKVMVKNELVPINLWDTAGQERYKSLTVAYFRGADGVFLCFSLVDEQSFNDLKGWNQEVGKFCPPHVVRMVVGMKLDLGSRAVSQEVAEDYAASIGASYCETSAKTKEGLTFALGMYACAAAALHSLICLYQKQCASRCRQQNSYATTHLYYKFKHKHNNTQHDLLLTAVE